MKNCIECSHSLQSHSDAAVIIGGCARALLNKLTHKMQSNNAVETQQENHKMQSWHDAVIISKKQPLQHAMTAFYALFIRICILYDVLFLPKTAKKTSSN